MGGDELAEAGAALPPLAAIMQQKLNDAHSTSQALIDSLQWQLDQCEAELKLIRESVEAAYSHPWIPQPAEVFNALWPTGPLVRELAEFRRSEREGRS